MRKPISAVVYLSIFMLLVPISLYANGDPVVKYCALKLSKAPVARQIPHIQIEKENLEIHLYDGFSRISVDYVLHNMSGKRFRRIHYGFPVDWEGEGPVHFEDDFWYESLHEKGWSDDYVTDFSFRLGSKQLIASFSADTLIKKGFTAADWHRINGYPNWKEESLNFHDEYSSILAEMEWEGNVQDSLVLDNPEYRRWYYTVFSIKPHETVTLHIEYTLKHPYSRSLWAERCEFADELWTNHFIYDFAPAAAWGDGTTGELNLAVHYPDSTSIRNFRNFDYATAAPLELDYHTRTSDNNDVESIRKHRLDPSRYRIIQGDNDDCSYSALSDLDGRTGMRLTPSSNGDFELSVILDSCIKVTGLVIMNGNCRDSCSWVSDGYAERMMISRSVSNRNYRWVYDYAEHYPKACPTIAPEDYSWDSMVHNAIKVNMEQRIWPENSYVETYPSLTDRIVIYFPKQEKDVYLSEVIVLYEDYVPSDDSLPFDDSPLL